MDRHCAADQQASIVQVCIRSFNRRELSVILSFPFRYTHSSSSPRRPANELNQSVTLLALLNDHMLRPHTKAAIGTFFLFFVGFF